MLPEPSEEEIQRYNAVTSMLAAFQKSAAPLAFKWIEWTAVLSLLIYVEQKTSAWPITALIWVLAILLWGYFIQFFSRPYEWRPYKQLFSRARMVDWVLGMAATGSMVAASFWFANLLSLHPF